MKLPDVSVLVNAVNEASAEHACARDWLQPAFDAPAGVGLTWATLLGFVHLSTRRGILANPLRVEDAIRVVDQWLAAPRARILEPTEQHWVTVSRLLRAAGKAGNLTTDAHLAALAIEHGATLVSFDRDFARFDGLDFERLRA
jgi:uncharacterized protein